MKTRWVYGFLLVMFAFTGIHYNNTQAPNQQIVVQFQENDLSAENTLTRITQQLSNVGISQISIEDSGSKGFVITYYSTSDVSSIQDILIKEGLITTTVPERSDDSIPSETDSNIVTVDISEIQNSHNNAWDFEGTMVAEFKEHLDRPITLNTCFTIQSKGDKESKSLNDSKQILNGYSFVAINFTSYQIPEVRAGPIC